MPIKKLQHEKKNPHVKTGEKLLVTGKIKKASFVCKIFLRIES